MDVTAIWEIRFDDICPTSEGDKVDHMSPTKRLSTTGMETLSTKVFNATFDTGFSKGKVIERETHFLVRLYAVPKL